MIHKEKKAKQRVGRKSGRYEHDPWRPVQTKISSESPDFKKPCFSFLYRSVLQSHFCQHGHTWDFIVSPLRSLHSFLKHSVFIQQLCHDPSSPRDSDLFPCWDLYLLEWPTSPSLLFAFWLNRFCCISSVILIPSLTWKPLIRFTMPIPDSWSLDSTCSASYPELQRTFTGSRRVGQF